MLPKMGPRLGPHAALFIKKQKPTCSIIEDLENTDSIKKNQGLPAIALTRESRSSCGASFPSFPSAYLYTELGHMQPEYAFYATLFFL